MTALRIGGGAAFTGAALLIVAAAAARLEPLPAVPPALEQGAGAAALAWHRVPPRCRRSYRLMRKGEVWTPSLAVVCLEDEAGRITRTR